MDKEFTPISGLRIVPRDPAHPDAQALLVALGEALARITGNDGTASFQPEDVRGPGAAFLVAYRDGVPVACGGYRPVAAGVAEVKRVYSAQPGAGRALLQALEARAAADGYARLLCETRRVNTRAVAFYQRAGWSECPPYGRYIGRPEAICLTRALPGTGEAAAQAAPLPGLG